jgi:hypothetical protein
MNSNIPIKLRETASSLRKRRFAIAEVGFIHVKVFQCAVDKQYLRVKTAVDLVGVTLIITRGVIEHDALKKMLIGLMANTINDVSFRVNELATIIETGAVQYAEMRSAFGKLERMKDVA